MFKKSARKFILPLTLCLALIALPALALDLHEARRAGQIGEQNDGFVTVLKGDDAVTALAQDVNGKRQQEYAKIAAGKGQPVAVVAKLAAAQIVQGLEPGAKYQDAKGSWQTR